MRAAVTMVEVETEMVWVGDLAKAETLLSAIEGHVKGNDLREVREQVDSLLAALASAEAKFDSNN